jgi:hypothetical protein
MSIYSNMWVLAFLILSAAILSCFLNELKSVFKKTFKNEVTRVVVPLLVVSGIFASHEGGILGVLLSTQSVLRDVMVNVAESLPFVWGAVIVEFCCLLVLISLPAMGLYGLMHFKRWKNPAEGSARLFAMLGVFWVILWIA